MYITCHNFYKYLIIYSNNSHFHPPFNAPLIKSVMKSKAVQTSQGNVTRIPTLFRLKYIHNFSPLTTPCYIKLSRFSLSLLNNFWRIANFFYIICEWVYASLEFVLLSVCMNIVQGVPKLEQSCMLSQKLCKRFECVPKTSAKLVSKMDQTGIPKMLQKDQKVSQKQIKS